MWGREQRICRVCGKGIRARETGRADVVALLHAYGDLDVPLTDALGVQWPYKLLRAQEGRYARV